MSTTNTDLIDVNAETMELAIGEDEGKSVHLLNCNWLRKGRSWGLHTAITRCG